MVITGATLCYDHMHANTRMSLSTRRLEPSISDMRRLYGSQCRQWESFLQCARHQASPSLTPSMCYVSTLLPRMPVPVGRRYASWDHYDTYRMVFQLSGAVGRSQVGMEVVTVFRYDTKMSPHGLEIATVTGSLHES